MKRTFVQWLLIGVITFYRKAISPYLMPRCRFQPTCSAYSIEAIERYGAAKGGWLALKRVGRCHPWGGAGYDPVPTKYEANTTQKLDAHGERHDMSETHKTNAQKSAEHKGSTK